MEGALPVLVAVIVAILGSIGGVAALLKVNADNSNTVSDAAAKVVEMMDKRLDEQDERLKAVETYVEHFDVWADKLLNILDRAISKLPETVKDDFITESNVLKSQRPRRR